VHRPIDRREGRGVEIFDGRENDKNGKVNGNERNKNDQKNDDDGVKVDVQ
jgi:hypothetical protein